MYTVSEIANIIKAQPEPGLTGTVEHILLDSRKLLFPASSLFFALPGARRNGQQFIGELYNKGLRYFVVEKIAVDPVETSTTGDLATQYPGAVFLKVGSVIQSLHLLSTYHREHFNIPVIGITGSNGKTIVKEWLYQLLEPDHSVVRSPKSYNSQVGVPLSVWQMNADHSIGIFEAGISQPDEMQQLGKVISPTIGVFTNVGDAHGEGFLNIRQKINEKLKLFMKAEVLIYNADDPDINEAVSTFKNNVRPGDEFLVFSWSRKSNASLQVTDIEILGNTSTISAIHDGINLAFTIPFTDEASIENAISCCCVLLYLRVGNETIAERMLHLRPVEMRLELKQGINNCSVINDSYSADINSLTIALDFLLQQQQHNRKTLVLSDILQSGKSSAELYTEVASILAQKKINRFIGIGPELGKQRAAFAAIPEINFYESTAAFREQFHNLQFRDETILLKGARLFEFEQISNLLEQKVHQTVMEINLNAITHNLQHYQRALKPGTQLMAMVKAFSYGSGSFEIANLLQFHKVDYLAVAYADEGVELRKAGISVPLMVMNVEESSFDVLVQYNLEPELYSFGIFTAFEQYLKLRSVKGYPVHLKLDTGMRRLGFEAEDIPELCKKLSGSSFKIQTVFSHLAGSDSADHDGFTATQAASFLKSCELLQAACGYSFKRHLSNTAAIFRHKELQLDMVRLGIGLYGVDANPGMQTLLRNVTTLKTTISQIKKVKKGESVGYSRKGITLRDSEIATVRIGYADGYPRILSNGIGKMWIKGTLVPVIGNVCMDMTMLDITGLDINEGDEVLVFGEALPVTQLAEWANTIPYEILTGISQRVKRVYYEE